MLKLLRMPKSIQNIYLSLVLGNTLAASFIWGINTIFLLNAGLSNFEAFLANAFFTAGEVIFEIPTGIIADIYGRRTSYLLGAITLSLSTLAYLYMWTIRGPFIGWALSSVLLGLGFTFFSGALEAWLVDALHFTKFKGNLDSVFAKGQIVGGIAMLTGSVLGGVIAQFTNLGIPYVLRALVLGINFLTAFFLMRDLGFSPKRNMHPLKAVKDIFKSSVNNGLKNPPVRWVMFAGLFTSGVSFYVFYALQPFVLQLYGNEKAYAIAGVVAAFTALSNILGGYFAPKIRSLFKKRTSILLLGIFLTSVILFSVFIISSFYAVLLLIFLWGFLFASLMPIRQAYLNGVIKSEQRATVLSFDSMIGSTGGIAVQPILGRAADVWNYSTSYAIGAAIELFALPFLYLAKRENAKSDKIK